MRPGRLSWLSNVRQSKERCVWRLEFSPWSLLDVSLVHGVLGKVSFRFRTQSVLMVPFEYLHITHQQREHYQTDILRTPQRQRMGKRVIAWDYNRGSVQAAPLGALATSCEDRETKFRECLGVMHRDDWDEIYGNHPRTIAGFRHSGEW